MGMRYRRPNRAKHGGYPAGVQAAAIISFFALMVGPLMLGALLGKSPSSEPSPEPFVADPELLAEIRANTLRQQAALGAPDPQALRERALFEEATRAHNQQMALLDAQVAQQREQAAEYTRVHNRLMADLDSIGTDPTTTP